MKLANLLVLFILILVGNFSAHAQTDNSLYLKSNFWGNKFFKGDTIISVNQVLYEMSPNESTYNLMLSAKKDFVLAQILGATGGLFIGIPIGTALVGGEPNWILAGIGVGIIGITIPISMNFKKKANEAISLHNRRIKNSAQLECKPTYNLQLGSNGLNLQFRF